jgi:hypothetical protein
MGTALSHSSGVVHSAEHRPKELDMSYLPGGEPPFRRDELAPEGGFDSVAHIEGLVGEEDALLRIPAEERTHEQHARLREIEHELNHLWGKLRERAERLGHHSAGA